MPIISKLAAVNRIRIAGICIPVMALVGIVAVAAAVAMALSSGDEGPAAIVKANTESVRVALESRWEGATADWRALGDIQGVLNEVSAGLSDLESVRFITEEKDGEGRRFVFQSSNGSYPLTQPLQAMPEWVEANVRAAAESDRACVELSRSEKGACGTGFAPVRGKGGVLLGFVEAHVNLTSSGGAARGFGLGSLLVVVLGSGIWVWAARVHRRESSGAGEESLAAESSLPVEICGSSGDLPPASSSETDLGPGRLGIETILDRADVGVVVFDSEGKVRLCNRCAAEILGAGEGGRPLWGRNASLVCRPFPGLAELVETPADSQDQSVFVGGDRSVSVTANEIFVDGSRCGLVLTLRDVTAQMERERDIGEAAERLLAARREIDGQSEELAAANAALERLSTADPVTGLANHRRFMEVLSQEAERAQATARPLSLALIDIGSFSDYNERFGYAAGDEVLRTTSRVVGRGLRRSDVAGRLAGGRLGAILLDTDLASALVLADRLAKHLEVASFSGQRIRFNIVVAEFGRHAVCARGLLEAACAAADAAMPAPGNTVAAVPDTRRGSEGRESRAA